MPCRQSAVRPDGRARCSIGKADGNPPGLTPAGGPPPKQAQIGILGLGYVGLPLMRRYAEVGYPVLGFDIDPAKVDQLNAGQS